ASKAISQEIAARAQKRSGIAKMPLSAPTNMNEARPAPRFVLLTRPASSFNRALRLRHLRGLALGALGDGALHGFGEDVGLLGAGHGEAAAADEAGTPVDAGPRERLGLGRHDVDILIRGEPLAYLLGVHAAFLRRADQHLAVRKVAAFGEVEVHQALLHAG